jgi:ABC-2 type transport system ATP-binding protein
MAKVPAFEVRDLRKVYPSPPVIANDGLSFAVSPGEAFGLLGPNGAGKSTLVRQLVGLMRPTSGEIKLFGEPLRRTRRMNPRLGRTVAYLPQGSLAQGDWKVAEAISWTGRLRGLSSPTARRETEDLLRDLELTELAERQLRKLSGGQKRLVQIGMTLVGRLPVLILDEPTTDIDPVLRRRIWSMIASRARAGAAVILVTHDVAEAEQALDRVAILDKGRLVAAGTPAELKSSLAHRTRLEVTVAEDRTADPYEIAALIGSRAKVEGRRVSGWVPAEEAVRILEKVVAEATPEGLEDVRLVTPTLEDVYLETSGHGLEQEAESQ